jgi:hypothetical protein
MVLVLVAVYVPPRLIVVVDSQTKKGSRLVGSKGAPLAMRNRAKKGRNFIMSSIADVFVKILVTERVVHGRQTDC